MNPPGSVRVFDATGPTVTFADSTGPHTHCLLELVNSTQVTVNVNDSVLTTGIVAIRILDDASTDNTIYVRSDLGADTYAIFDAGGANIVDLEDGAKVTATIEMGGGADTVIIRSGAVVEANIQMGAGDDTIHLHAGSHVTGSIDGGGDTDTLRLMGSGSGEFDFARLLNIEILSKSGEGSWRLIGTGSAVQLGVEAGMLNVGGDLTVSGKTTIAGGVLHIEAGASIDAQGGLSGTDDTDDGLHVAGSLTVPANVSLGDGNDTLTLTDGFSVTPGTVFDGGAGTDTLLLLAGTGDGILDLANFTGFEIVQARGAGFWTLISGDPAAPATVQSIRVDAGTLVLLGLWQVTGNTTTVNVGSELIVGDGGTQSVLNEAQDLEVFGRLTIRSNGLVTVAGLSTVGPEGRVTVEAGGAFQVGDLVVQGMNTVTGPVAGVVYLLGGGSGSAAATTVAGGAIVLGADFDSGDAATFGAASFVASGPVLIGEAIGFGGTIFILPTSTFTAQDTTTVGTNSDLLVAGTYVAHGAVGVEDGGRLALIEMNDPTGAITGPPPVFTALSSTTVTGADSFISVGFGQYDAVGPVTVQDRGSIEVIGSGVFNATAGTVVTREGMILLANGGQYLAGQPIQLTDGGALHFAQDVAPGGLAGTIVGTVENVSGTVGGGKLFGLPFGSTLRIVGAYNQGAGGNYASAIEAGQPADLMVVEGETRLAGNVTVVVVGAFALSDQVRIIATDRPIEGMFDTASLRGAPIGRLTAVVLKTNDGGLFAPQDGNNVDVLFVDSALPQLGLSGNQAAVAAVLTEKLPVGGIVIARADVLAGVFGMLNPNVLEQVGPESYDSFTAFSFDVARQYGALIGNRARTLRCAAAGGGGGAGAFCGPGQALFASDRGTGPTPFATHPVATHPVATHQVADAGPPSGRTAVAPRGITPVAHPSGWSVWAAGLGAGIWKDRTSDNLGYSGWTTGGAAGVDLALSRRFVIGVLAGGTRSNIDFRGVSGDGDLESVTTGVYAAWYGRRLFADAGFTYTKNWVEADRDITFLPPTQTANGKTEGDQYAAHATLGMGFKLRRLSVEASGGLDWVSLRQNGFTETGAGVLNLTVDGRTDSSLRLRAGIRLARAWLVRPGLVVAPSLRVGYAREMFDNTRPITATLAGGGGAFTVNGDEGGRDFITFGGGLQAEWSQGLTLFVAHSGEWAQDRTSHSFTGGIKVRW